MPPGKRIDYSFLGESAIRLARLLGVGGLISPQFDSGEKLIPTVSVGDAAGIGYRGEALRAFAYGASVAAAVGFTSKLFIKAPVTGNGIIIDGWMVSALGTAGAGYLAMLDPTTGDPFPITQTNTLWVERMTVPTERSGVLTVADNSDALSYGLAFSRFHVPTGAAGLVIPTPIMLLPEGKAVIGLDSTNTLLHATFWGRAL